MPVPRMRTPAVPAHELLRRIGAGSYGEVWLSRSALGTFRAVKIVRRAAFDDDRPYEREFAGLQQFEPLSRTHEGFVDLLQVGRDNDEGWFYYVMELADAASGQGPVVSGQSSEPAAHAPSAGPLDTDPLITDYSPRTLAAEAKLRGAQPLDDCLRIARTLTGALAELHRHGLVHRDIKPSNIIFVGGVPKLADVGLVAAAKGVGQDRSFVGTEGFIPPEGPGTPQADLYSLGIVLYMLSTGKSHRDFPEPPADLATRPDHGRWLELSAVIYRAAHADPRERYASAKAMLADLERLAAGKSVKRRWATQRLLRRAGLFMVAGALVAAVVSWPARRANMPGTGIGWTTNQAASDAWTKANYLADYNDSAKRATQRQLFEQAIRLDPDFAYAHASLAGVLEGQACSDLQPLEQWPEAERHLRRASELEPRLAWNHLQRALWLTLVQYDWHQAEAEIQLALRLEPTAHHRRNRYAMLLIWLGRFDEALKQIRMAIDNDVAAGGFHDVAALAYYYDRQFTKALAELDQVDQLAAYNTWGQQTRAHTYMALGRTDEALALYRRIVQEVPNHIYAHAFLFYAATVANKRLPSDPTLQYLLDHSSEPRGAFGVALAYTALGDKTKALDWLDKAYERREWDMREIKPDFRLDSLRTEPRFRELLKKMNLE